MSTSLLKRHWFVPMALLVVAGAIVAATTANWQAEAATMEAALLLDLCVLVPALYFWCYRTTARSPALRALALSCTGVWVASHLIPTGHYYLLGFVSWLRFAAIGLLLYVEVRVLASLYWLVIKGEKSAEDAATALSASTGMPPQVASLLAREAAFWRRLLGRLVRFLRRK